VRVRTGAIAACAAAAVLVLAACGSTSTDPLAPAHAFTDADRETARQVDVQQSDVPPEYRPHGSQQSGRQQCAPDLGSLTLTAVDRSRPFVTRGATSYVVGEVDLYRTAEQASTALRRVTGSSRLRCLLGIAHRALAGYDHGRIVVRRLTLPGVPFGSKALGRRFAESWREAGDTHAQTTDDVYLTAGRTLVILSFFRDRGVFPPRAEARLIERVAGRAVGAQPGRTRTRPGGNTTKGE
jgi:hypothetical protein